MRKLAIKIFNRTFPKYGNYGFIVRKNVLRNIFIKRSNHKYLFILSPPYCGSTLLNEVISSSDNVSVNNPFGTREGQTLPTVRNIMFDPNERWDGEIDFDWVSIKNEWRKYWDLTRPILLEKSPPNIIRAKSIERNFDNSYFIIFHRNPYAQCESLIRRNEYEPTKAALFAIENLIAQKRNILELKNKIQISYEALTQETQSISGILSNFIPELINVDVEKEFSAHNYLNRKMKILNLNEEKIKKISDSQLNEINAVFIKNLELLDFFKYELIANLPSKKF